MMGSPMVFHTAPPHPASNARITCSPQLVGGAEASQKGFGQRMPPANVVLKSGMHSPKRFHDSQCRALAIRHRVYHLASAVDAIAAGKILGAARSFEQ